jgi:adenine-specific DNA-methyltransferase
MKKVLYYDESGISKDEDIKKHYNEYKAGGFFKYLYLEQYEDTLENVDFENDYLQERTQELERIKELYPEFTQKELLRLLKQFVVDNTKTLLMNVVNLVNPFDYTIKLAEGKEVLVDFVETFNLMKPVYVKRIFEREFEGKRYIFVDGGSIGVVWREAPEEYDREFAKREEEFIKQNLPDYENKKEIFVNGILSYPKSFLDFKAKEVLTEFRKLLLQGVSVHEEG